MTDVNALEAKLKNQQWVGGQQPTAADKEAFEALKAGPVAAETHPHTFAWFCLVWKFTDAVRDSWPAAGAGGKGGKEGGKGKGGKKGGKKEEAPKETKKDDDVEMDDLFGDDNEEDAEAAKKAAEAAKNKNKKKKKKEVEMSMVMLEVKPMDDQVDLDKVAAKIFADFKQDGLFWKTEYKKEPVAFGIFKLIVGMSLEDEKVSVDDIVEKIEGLEDMVQSVEIASFSKI